ncbi:MAG: HAMP domain-containing histidine kinase [Proteobacteria bacterium]|nr:MAG: HAMP domain-containing histidine kinase [Pseudomonadota bacterium]
MIRIRGSIFFKLFGILIITGILLNFLFYFAIKYFASDNPIKRDMFETFRQENLRAFVVQIGFPPDVEKMKFIAQTTEAEIRVESGGQVWQTTDDLTPIREIEEFQKGDRKRHKDHEDHGPQFRGPPPGKRMPVFFDFFSKFPPPPAFVITQDGVKYAFFLPDRRDFAGRYGRLMIPLLLILTFLIASAFFAIRYILLPVNSLMKGVQAVGQGDLDYRVSVKGGTEFATLGESFNLMVERIKETMEAKERLLIDVSHELQSPLARMKLAIELMTEEKAKERLKVNLKDIETMVAEILESARLDSSTGSLVIQKTNVYQLIKEFFYVYETMGSPVHLHTTETEVIAMIDPARFIIVMRNLIDNALKYADNQEKRVDIYLTTDEKLLSVRVKDNGKPIDTTEVHKLFEPFYRIDKSRTRATGGYGLGLSLCKRIVDAHGGAIGIESSKDGTEVWFNLPKGL